MIARSDQPAQRILVTGGAGFIGSALIRYLIHQTPHGVLNVDALTYAGNPSSLRDVEASPRYRFLHADVCDAARMAAALADFQPTAITHLAAETHVDRSIDGPAIFVQTNIVGTFTMLSAATQFWRGLDADARSAFRFHHISTDEVFGSLPDEGFFTEQSHYDPRSPYAATKASSDHLVRAWHETYGLPVLITNCSNNYGPFQYPEKLIPLMIIKALAGAELPVYGAGANVRDWLHVEDHVLALAQVFGAGVPGESYMIGARAERSNIVVVKLICDVLDRLRPRDDGHSYREQVRHVEDRPGHDRRYAIDPAKIERELGWTPREGFETGIERTVRWYLDNEWWWRPLVAKRDAVRRVGLASR